MAAYSETLTVICSMGGNSRISRDGYAQIKYSIDLDAMTPGVAAALSDTNKSVITVATGNTITSGFATVYWSGGYRTNMVISAGADTSITVVITGGASAGTTFPVGGIAECWVSKAAIRSETFLGTNMEILNISVPIKTTDYDVTVNFMTSTTINLTAVAAGGECYSWASGTGVTNPITGDTISTIQFYNNSLTASTVTIGVLIA